MNKWYKPDNCFSQIKQTGEMINWINKLRYYAYDNYQFIVQASQQKHITIEHL